MIKRYKKIIVICSILIILIVTFSALWIVSADSDTFPNKTFVNNTDCSNMNAKQAAIAVTENLNKNKFHLIDSKTGKELGAISNLNFDYDLNGKIEDKMKWANFISTFNFIGGDINMSVDTIPQKVTASIINQLKKMPFVTDKSLVKTKDAYVSIKNSQFPIVNEVYGTSVDIDKLGLAVINQIADGNWQLKYVPDQYYEIPKIKSSNEKIIQRKKFCEKYLTKKIEYDLFNDKYTISIKELNGMLQQDGDKAKVNEKGVALFVEKLAEKASTVGMEREFKSTRYGEVMVDDGTYGYEVDQDGEIEQLTEDLKKNEDVQREPVYIQRGIEGRGNEDIGNTYIEVDIHGQHLYYYKDGELIMDTDVVTGAVKDGVGTPRGVYYVFNKSRNAELEGENKDGSKYVTPVDYWMPITYSGIGFHDAKWRDKFGKTIYLYNGSHGCVNMPLDKAAELYSLIDVGVPAIVF